MSFGFSIGNIILLSQLAYSLYSSISSGRKAASRDLKELEDVLFSLKCALDHLGEASKDVLARPDRHGRTYFKEKLDAMINACASTLKELEAMTEKYRSVETAAVENAATNKGKAKLRTLDDMKKSIQVNWHRVRWDYEKQSLQQYREKLESHTDAINLILTSMIWANSTLADEKSTKSHEKTHGLLEQVLKKSEADDSVRSIVEDIRNMLTQADLGARKAPETPTAPLVLPSDSTFIAACSHSPSPVTKGSGFAESYTRRSASVNMDLNPALPIRPPHRHMKRVVFPAGAAETPSQNHQHTLEVQNELSSAVGRIDLSPETIDLNARRRAFGEDEYEAFRQRHPTEEKARKPSFLTPATPTMKDLYDGILYLFGSLPEGKQKTDELKFETERWIQGLSLLVKNTTPDAKSDNGFLHLLQTLNRTVEGSAKSVRGLFYEVSGSAGLLDALDQVSATSKSVRVMKEIEDFQDAKEEWEDDHGGN
ncbi:hypothetical protein COCMIDRAFT_37284 [Bipolaris oryzae ATCC 44560]|uniref:Fungal N-terminal domain-containing protein n=1 Tax=Bipolaris oryzae ATCC 44560 TaxID=930090 RepID=W6Z4Q0_COCMI|nr:uncharacterized protein COCMIDRAFT_37284 [Bipolaris oryzae ATCC 44560]EUC44955.1 hypothetical protein COCMIDRAFT_37284 [Bipolaris oryzae ATCC 44560]